MIANPNDGNTPQVEQATPSISVSSGGLITAKTEQEKGYVPGGTKSSTKQLTTQAAKTVTPGTTNQTAVASGRYTTGAVTVKGDVNLKAENIAEGVSIFGVAGTHSGGGGEAVTVSIIPNNPYTVFYTNASGELVNEFHPSTISVLKNTVLGANAPAGNATGGVTIVATMGGSDGGASVMLVTDHGAVRIG